ncbi:MAG: 16S rRNA (guanine(527)-N(7))-methyltransferase RsmG [Rhodospirillaceae bacterium]|nr:16S rRNA (guanine(527)-N(7))-methyltransferase RsmG [Rhodospirillaceae bacterium]
MKQFTHYGPSDFQRDLKVSAETLQRLEAYAALLQTWNKTTNLVGPATIPDLWFRHMLDSAQLYPFTQDSPSLVDLGSGAGFPGLVLAILGQRDVHLVESDQKKVAFLREAARVAGVKPTFHPARIESLSGLPTALICARALAPVDKLLALSAKIATPETKFVFLKGQNVEVELTEAHKIWRMEAESHVSRTDSTGRVVILREVSPHDRGHTSPRLTS